MEFESPFEKKVYQRPTVPPVAETLWRTLRNAKLIFCYEIVQFQIDVQIFEDNSFKYFSK